jgi:hypothetical protein
MTIDQLSVVLIERLILLTLDQSLAVVLSHLVAMAVVVFSHLMAVVDQRLLTIDRSLVVQVRFVTKLVLDRFTVVLDQSRMMINPLVITMFDDHSVAKSVDRFLTSHDQ